MRVGVSVTALVALLVGALVLAVGAIAAAGDDSDGDRIPDAQDTCPLVYDPQGLLADSTGPQGQPIRSADWDHDGLGNICDPTTGMPGDHYDAALWLRASDGSTVAHCAEVQYTWHYSDGSSLTQSQACAFYLGSAGIFSTNGRYLTSVEYTVTRNPEGCSDPNPSATTLDLQQGGVYLRKSIFFQGASCGIGITKATTPPPATTTPTPPPATPTPATAPPVTVADKLTRAGQAAKHTVPIPAGVSTVTITVKWSNPGAAFALAGIREAGSSLSTSTTRTRTSLVVRVSGVDAGRLAYALVARHVSRPTAVTTRITRR
jgi:hypothetical protein